MNKEVRELRKAGEMAGIEVSWFGEVISSKTRKFYNSLNKIKGCNLKTFNKVLQEAKKFNISNVTILKCNEWIGNYGRVASDLDFINTRHIHSHIEAPIKQVYRVIRGVYNWHNDSKYLFVEVDTNNDSKLFDLYYIPEGFKKIQYGERENEILILMANGQVFDIYHQYYYSKKDSKELKKYIKEHGYDSPNDFYEYLNPYSDYEESEGCPE